MGALSSLLVQDQVLGVTQIEQALQRQVILGGDLPTILLELRMLDERVLVDYMSKVVGVPVLDAKLYDAPNSELRSFFSKETALACKAVPIVAGDDLLVAVTGALPPAHQNRLTKECGLTVVPHLVLEFRLALMLNQTYGIPLTGRLSTLQKKILPDFECVQFVSDKHTFDRPTSEPKSSVALEEEVDEKISIESSITRDAEHTSRFYRGPQPPNLSRVPDTARPDTAKKDADAQPQKEIRKESPPRIDDIAARVRLTAPPDSIIPEIPDREEVKDLPSTPLSPQAGISIPPSRASSPGMAPLTRKNLKKPLIGFSEAAAMLEEAENRDDILETFFHFAHQAFDFTFLAVVHGEDASGRLAAYRGGSFNDADFVSIQLDEEGLFARAFKSATYQIGPMDDAVGLNALNQLGLDIPLNAAVIPVVLRQRVILLLYGDSGHHGIRAKRVERIAEFSRLVATAFERLLLARKLRKFSSVPPPPLSDTESEAFQEAIKVDSKQVARPRRDLSAFLASDDENEEATSRNAVGVFSASDAAPDLETALAFSNRMSKGAAAAADDATSTTSEDAATARSATDDSVAHSADGDSNKVTVHAPNVLELALKQQEAEARKINKAVSDETRASEPPPAAEVDVPPESKIQEEAHASDDGDDSEGVDSSDDGDDSKGADVSEGADVSDDSGSHGRVQISVSPQAMAEPVAENDSTLKIHIEDKAQPIEPQPDPHKAPTRPAIRVIEPIRVSGGNRSKASELSDESTAVETTAQPDQTADAEATESGNQTSPHDNVAPVSGAIEGALASVPSYVPRSTLTDGRYMQMDKEFQKSEKSGRKHTAQGYMVPESSPKDEPQQSEGSQQIDEESADQPSLEPRQTTAGYADLSKDQATPKESSSTEHIVDLSIPAAHIDDAAIDGRSERPTSPGDTKVLDVLVAQLISGEFDDDVPARILAGGEDAILALIERFPGPLTIDRFQEAGKLPEISSHGPLLRLLTMFGNKVVPHVVPLLDSFDSEIRFYSTFLFYELRNREILHLLVKRVFDNDRQIRSIAVDALTAHRGTFEYKSSIEDIAMILVGASTSLEKKRIAAEALGQLKDAAAVEALASMLGSVDGILSERCQKALVRITFRDFGFSEKRWLSWYRANSGAHRIEWAIEGIVDKNEDIRRLALNELKTELGNEISWPRPPYDFSQRKALHKKLIDWWQSEGKSRHVKSEA